MKIVIISNAITPHQVPLCEAFLNQGDVDLHFIESYPIDKTTLPPGWKTMDCLPYVVNYQQLQNDRSKYDNIIMEADLVVLGAADEKIVLPRLKTRKPVFLYSERLYKSGYSYKKYIRNAISSWLHHGRYQKYPLYMLCASAYTAADHALFGRYKNRCLKWGYFPRTIKHDDFDSFYKDKDPKTILWAGRFIDWKHPELALKVAKRLKADGIQYQLNMVGSGEMQDQLMDYCKDEGLEDYVYFLGSMSPNEVRMQMDKSGICLCTSDFNEGWGAIVNESMNSACAVVGSHAMGSVPYLINSGTNGFVFESENVEQLYNYVKELLMNVDMQRSMGYAAYNTIAKSWNAEVAARRLRGMASIVQGGSLSSSFVDGICSFAPLLDNNWINQNNN